MKKSHAAIVKESIEMVREHVGPVAFFKAAAVVERLPKTRSGKILRGKLNLGRDGWMCWDLQPNQLGTMKQIADGVAGTALRVPPTIEDHAVLEEITLALKKIGFAKSPSATS